MLNKLIAAVTAGALALTGLSAALTFAPLANAGDSEIIEGECCEPGVPNVTGLPLCDPHMGVCQPTGTVACSGYTRAVPWTNAVCIDRMVPTDICGFTPSVSRDHPIVECKVTVCDISPGVTGHICKYKIIDRHPEDTGNYDICSGTACN